MSKNNNNNNKRDGGEEKKIVSVTVVLKVNMHCDGCASKIVKSVRAFQGVKTVKAESETGKLTVTGDVDPAKLREQLEETIKKKVELVSPQVPKKDKEKDNNKDKNTSTEDKKTEEKKPKEAPPVTTTVLKLECHCQGCIEKIQKTVTKTKGVSGLSVDNEKQLVTLKGTMDVKKLVKSLTEKLKRNVEIVPPAKKDKEKEKEKECGDEKKGDGEGVKMMVQPAHESANYRDGTDEYPIQSYAQEFFSDDNPNACVVM